MKPSDIVKLTKRIRRWLEKELKGGGLPGGRVVNPEVMTSEFELPSDLGFKVYNVVVQEWPTSTVKLESEIYKAIETYEQNKDSHMSKYEKGKVRKGNVLLEAIDFAVDTALSWDGTFPKVDKGDFIVIIEDENASDLVRILVSRRYTAATDADQAAEIALDAYGERGGYSYGPGTSDIMRVVRVDAVMK